MVNFDEDTGQWIADQVESDEFDSKSGLIRHYFGLGRRAENEIQTKEERIEELERQLSDKRERIAELEEQLARRSQLEDKIEDLPDKIRDEMSYQDRRQRMLDQATVTQRLKWRVTGVPVENEE